MVTTMQAKGNNNKLGVLFTVHIFSYKGKDVEDVKVLRRYLIFAAVSGCISNRDFRFSTS